MKNTIKKLFFVSLAFNLLLIFFVMKSNMSEGVSANTPFYYKNQTYTMKTSNYDVFKTKQANIVMLGDSITYGVDWHELLGRQDIVNRGIGGDVTEGMLNRLYYVFKVKPKIVFLMGGINDIMSDYATPEKITKNQKLIIEKLKKQNIKPVITSTLYVSSSLNNYKSINAKVDKLNSLLKQLAADQEIDYIDLNSKLANGTWMNSKYTIDGVHLLGNAYEIWGAEISKILANSETLFLDQSVDDTTNRENKNSNEQLSSTENITQNQSDEGRYLKF